MRHGTIVWISDKNLGWIKEDNTTEAKIAFWAGKEFSISNSNLKIGQKVSFKSEHDGDIEVATLIVE